MGVIRKEDVVELLDDITMSAIEKRNGLVRTAVFLFGLMAETIDKPSITQKAIGGILMIGSLWPGEQQLQPEEIANEEIPLDDRL